MFPQTDLNEEIIKENGTISFAFDFEKGDFNLVDGKLVKTDSTEALKTWIQKVLRTEKFKFKIYDTGEQSQYGVSLIDFISNDYPFEFVKTEIEREIKEALANNNAILRVYSFEFQREKRRLECSFKVDSIYGTIGGEITV